MATEITRRRRSARLAVVIAVTACASKMAGNPAEPGQEPSEGGQKTAGALLFEKHCAKCHGVAGKGTDRAPKLVGEGALARFSTAQEVFDFASTKMPRDAPGSLTEGDYWAIVGFDVRANGIDLDAPLGPDSASSVQLHAGKTDGAAPADADAAKSE